MTSKIFKLDFLEKYESYEKSLFYSFAVLLNKESTCVRV